MKNYKFKIKKIVEDEIEIEAKNKTEALRSIIKLLGISEQLVLKNMDKNKQNYEIKLEKVTEIKEEIIQESNQYSDEEIKKIMEELDEDIETKISDKNEEIEDDLPKEYTEIVCKNCGNCILLDEDLLS